MVAVICVALTTTTLPAATPPNVTVAPALKLLPARMTLVPPPAGPVIGVTDDKTGASTTVTYPAPEDLEATRNSWLVATATATDSRGLSTTARRRLLPREVEDRIDRAFTTGFASVRAYVKTQAIVAAVDAAGIGIGALVLGLPLVLPLTIVVFFASFVPVVGAFISGALVVLIAWFSQGFVTALIMLGIVLAVQQIEGNVLQPVLMSRAVDLHPWGVIIGVTDRKSTRLNSSH